MLSNNSGRYVEYYFATLWAGCVMVPVNVRWSEHEIAESFDDAEPVLLLVDADHAELGARLRARCASLTAVILAEDDPREGFHGYESLIATTPAADDARRGGEDLAALFYTGGTTGRSKGVMLTHNNLMANSLTAMVNMNITGDSVHLHVSPMYHVAGGARLFSVTVAGGTHAVLPRFEPRLFLSAVEKHRVTITVVVPTMLNRLLDDPALNDYDLSSLDLLCYGASPIPQALLERALERLPGVALLQSYGMTELSPVATVLFPRYHTFEGPDAGYVRSAGQPVYNADVEIVGPDDEIVPPGQVGEVCVRGPMVMKGYWRLDALTRETLRGGWMHTGDAGYLDERGFLFLVDRVKDMIVSGGENVYSAEVENVLHAHPAVHECAVIGVPSDAWGEAVHAVVHLKPGARLEADVLIEFCRERLAHYKCPKSIDFSSDELPKSGPGKILKTELRAPFWNDEGRGIH
jgi:acyl-CoA synthetase (AMP-forming)/AMP-acid ligase II